jgi:hypothetical protein
VISLSDWVSFKMTDDALILVSLGHSAHYYDVPHGHLREALSHRGKALSIVNKRLTDRDQITTDGTIGAVLGIILEDVSFSLLRNS